MLGKFQFSSASGLCGSVHVTLHNMHTNDMLRILKLKNFMKSLDSEKV